MVKKIPDEIKFVVALDPQNASAGTLAGNAIDTRGFDQACFLLMRGDPSGSPDAMTIDMRLQESDASGSGYADAHQADGSSHLEITQITDDSETSAMAYIFVPLEIRKRYLKVSPVLAFTNGSSPKVDITVLCMLTQADVLPVEQTASD